MNFKKGITVLFLALFAHSVTGHEGHDSALAKSQFGGIVKKTKNAYIEVVKDETIEIYVMNHDYKSLATPTLKVNAVAETKGKKIPLKLDLKDKKFVVATDLSKEKHFKLNVQVKIDTKDESAVFPLEN